MSPELRAMLAEQEWYNSQLNGMLDVLAVFVTNEDTPTGSATCEAEPAFSGGDDVE